MGNTGNARGVIPEAATVLGDPFACGQDPDDPESEDRFQRLGQSRRNRLLVAVHAEPAAEEIRIINARLAQGKGGLQTPHRLTNALADEPPRADPPRLIPDS